MGQGERRYETIACVTGVGLRPNVGLNVAFTATKDDNACDFANFRLSWVGRFKGAQDGVTDWKNCNNARRKDCTQTKRPAEPCLAHAQKQPTDDKKKQKQRLWAHNNPDELGCYEKQSVQDPKLRPLI